MYPQSGQRGRVSFFCSRCKTDSLCRAAIEPASLIAHPRTLGDYFARERVFARIPASHTAAKPTSAASSKRAPQKNAAVAMVPKANDANERTSSPVEMARLPFLVRRQTNSEGPTVKRIVSAIGSHGVTRATLLRCLDPQTKGVGLLAAN